MGVWLTAMHFQVIEMLTVCVISRAGAVEGQEVQRRGLRDVGMVGLAVAGSAGLGASRLSLRWAPSRLAEFSKRWRTAYTCSWRGAGMALVSFSCSLSIMWRHPGRPDFPWWPGGTGWRGHSSALAPYSIRRTLQVIDSSSVVSRLRIGQREEEMQEPASGPGLNAYCVHRRNEAALWLTHSPGQFAWLSQGCEGNVFMEPTSSSGVYLNNRLSARFLARVCFGVLSLQRPSE
jgi:hypothetical protein